MLASNVMVIIIIIIHRNFMCTINSKTVKKVQYIIL